MKNTCNAAIHSSSGSDLQPATHRSPLVSRLLFYLSWMLGMGRSEMPYAILRTNVTGSVSDEFWHSALFCLGNLANLRRSARRA
jgi:hypothetical protein